MIAQFRWFLRIAFGDIFKRISSLLVTAKLDNCVQIMKWNEKFRVQWKDSVRFYIPQQIVECNKKGQNCWQLFFGVKMAGQKCSHRHSKREGIGVPEVCVSQKSRKQVLWCPLSHCVYTFNFLLKLSWNFLLQKQLPGLAQICEAKCAKLYCCKFQHFNRIIFRGEIILVWKTLYR